MVGSSIVTFPRLRLGFSLHLHFAVYTQTGYKRPTNGPFCGATTKRRDRSGMSMLRLQHFWTIKKQLDELLFGLGSPANYGANARKSNR